VGLKISKVSQKGLDLASAMFQPRFRLGGENERLVLSQSRLGLLEICLVLGPQGLVYITGVWTQISVDCIHCFRKYFASQLYPSRHCGSVLTLSLHCRMFLIRTLTSPWSCILNCSLSYFVIFYHSTSAVQHLAIHSIICLSDINCVCHSKETALY